MQLINLLFYHRLIDLILSPKCQKKLEKFIQNCQKDHFFHLIIDENKIERVFCTYLGDGKIVLLYEDHFCSEIMMFFKIVNGKLLLSDFGNYISLHNHKFYNGHIELSKNQIFLQDDNKFLETLLEKSGMKTSLDYKCSYDYWLDFWKYILTCRHKYFLKKVLKRFLSPDLINHVISFFVQYDNLIYTN